MTGLHSLDGARYLRHVQHADPMLCRLVAHHCCAIIEAGERGLAGTLIREFVPPPRRLSDALTSCDMTTSPTASTWTSQAVWPGSTDTGPITWSPARSVVLPR